MPAESEHLLLVAFLGCLPTHLVISFLFKQLVYARHLTGGDVLHINKGNWVRGATGGTADNHINQYCIRGYQWMLMKVKRGYSLATFFKIKNF